MAQYFSLEENELCDEQNIIDDENECRVAALSIDFTDYTDYTEDDGEITTETESAYPRGCYHQKSNNVWFNNHPIGNRDSGSAPICRKGEFMFLHIIYTE